MGRQRLGDFIRKLDYLQVRPYGEYDRYADDPVRQFKEIDDDSHGDVTVDELQDAYLAFQQKVGIPDFPERMTPPSKCAKETAAALRRLTTYLLAQNADLTNQLAGCVFNTLVGLIRAGPGSGHCEIMEQLYKQKKILQTYVHTLGHKELADVMTVTKVTFKYTPSDRCTETKMGLLQRENLVNFFLLLDTKQCALIQREFLDVFKHYYLQLPNITEYKEYCRKIYFLTDEMIGHFEKKNPYLHLKDPEILKEHINIAKDLVFHENYKKGDTVDDANRKLLELILKAIQGDGMVAAMFDHLMSIIIDIENNDHVRKKAEVIFYKFMSELFNEMPKNTPVQQIYKSCLGMIRAVMSNLGMTCSDEIRLVELALEKVVLEVKKLSDEDVTQCLQIITNMLLSGRQALVDKAGRYLKGLKTKSKALDWKKHVETAKKLLDIIGETPIKKMQDDKNSNLQKTVGEYCDFIKELLQQLKKSKVHTQLQTNIANCLLNCIIMSPPSKAKIAEEGADEDCLDLSKEKAMRIKILKEFAKLMQQDEDDNGFDNFYLIRAVRRILNHIIDSLQSGVSDEENDILLSIFKIVSDGGDSVEEHFYTENDCPNWKMNIFQDVLSQYARQLDTSRLLPIMPNVFRWAKIALEEDHERMISHTISLICSLREVSPELTKHMLPEILDLMFESEDTMQLFSFVSILYPKNPKPVHDRLEDIFKSFDDIKEDKQRHFAWILNNVAQEHPEVLTKKQIETLFERYKKGADQEKYLVLMAFKNIAEKFPAKFTNHFSQLLDDTVFRVDVTSMSLRCSIIACVGEVKEQLSQRAVDYMMKHVESSDTTVAMSVVGQLNSVVKKHQNYMQKYKRKLERAEEKSTVPQLKDMIHDIILVLEGKSIENIAEDVQQQQEDLADLDEKVDVTIETVIKVGDKVIEHDKEIGELGQNMERIEERVDDVEEDLGDTKIKVEEIDNKTMSNAPKWSRDLTKLMNPMADNDWRLLASRLGYNNDDIRGWATQHDPCMALLSEWYATHKTSEASFGVLNALTEMNRMDGVVIVENAMKAAEGVVEDEEFEYPSPPPVFISYQWGFQNEVKLLKQHLNMAGYECWMDVGQMGGGDKLFSKIDNGIRGAKVVICCTTEKYAQSPNCNREVNLSVNLNKPIIPLLMEKMDWPPKGSMGPIFSEYLFIRFFQRGGEETPEKDKRYWPIPKFQELLMQLNFFVVPDKKLVKKEYTNWWAPMVEDITIDKNKGKKQTSSQKPQQDKSQVAKTDKSPLVFLSYQWGKQPQVKALYKRLTSMGYTVWMDIFQMGGGDSLYDKIDKGIRGCQTVVTCVTKKYSLSANCRREVSLADALKKPIIPLLLEQMKWPPDGPMSMVFTELLFINFYRDEAIQMTWTGEKFDELQEKLRQFVPTEGKAIKSGSDGSNKTTSRAVSAKGVKGRPDQDTSKNKVNDNRNNIKSASEGDAIKHISQASVTAKTTNKIMTDKRTLTKETEIKPAVESEKKPMTENKQVKTKTYSNDKRLSASSLTGRKDDVNKPPSQEGQQFTKETEVQSVSKAKFETTEKTVKALDNGTKSPETNRSKTGGNNRPISGKVPQTMKESAGKNINKGTSNTKVPTTTNKFENDKNSESKMTINGGIGKPPANESLQNTKQSTTGTKNIEKKELATETTRGENNESDMQMQKNSTIIEKVETPTIVTDKTPISSNEPHIRTNVTEKKLSDARQQKRTENMAEINPTKSKSPNEQPKSKSCIVL